MPAPLTADLDAVARPWLKAIVSAKALTIAITGKQKRAIVEAAIAEGASSAYPVGRILADVELPVDIHWSA